MSLDDELIALAREHEKSYELTRTCTIHESPSMLLRQLRAYLARLADHRKLKRTYEQPRSETKTNNITALIAEGIEFASDSVFSFKIFLEQRQHGWLMREFEFHLALVGRRVQHIRIHLKRDGAYDPLRVPRCHVHIDTSDPHIPFPIMNPRLTVHLICEHIEPNIGS